MTEPRIHTKWQLKNGKSIEGRLIILLGIHDLMNKDNYSRIVSFVITCSKVGGPGTTAPIFEDLDSFLSRFEEIND